MTIEKNKSLSLESITFRAMAADDLINVVQTEQGATAFPWSLKNFQDCLKAGHLAWVFCNSLDEIVGFTVIQKVVDETHLLNICVRRQDQGQGVGQLILKAVIAHAKQISSVLIVLEVRRSNNRAQALYTHAGFNEMSVRKDYYPAHRGREDAVLMGMDLALLSFFDQNG
jgi:ribosomal-protein-alanine N-acetyltransferase